MNAAPGYQTITDPTRLRVELPNDAGTLRVVAGSYEGASGPARTFTRVEVWDVTLAGGKPVRFDVPEGHTVTVVVLSGTVEINGAQIVRRSGVAILGQAGDAFTIEAAGDTKLLTLAGPANPRAGCCPRPVRHK